MSEQDHSNETFDERSDGDFLPFDETSNRSRMAREAKIGLSVIFILLVVLGFVVYDRTMRPDDATEAVADAESPEVEKKPAAAPEQPEPKKPPAEWNQRTVMQAKAPSAAGKVARSDEIESWGVGLEDRQPSKTDADSTAAASPRSFMPRLVPPAPTERYPEFRKKETAVQTAEGRQSGQVTVEDGEPGVAMVADTQRGVGPQLPGTASAAATTGEVQEKPLWERTTEVPRLAEKTTKVRYPDRYAQVEPVARPAGAIAGEPQTPTYRASPPSSYRTASELSAPTPRISSADPSSVAPKVPARIASAEIRPTRASTAQAAPTKIAPAQPAVVQARPSDPTSLVRKPGERWALTGTAASAKPGLSNVSSRPQAAAQLNQQLTNTALPRKAGVYVVQPNDSYWRISQRVYGTDAYFRALIQHNRSTVPDANRLRVGAQILAPDAAELERRYPDLCPKLAHLKAAERRMALGNTRSAAGSGRVYVVQEGDNLFDIARFELGRPTRWTEIVNLNQELLGSDLDQLNYLTPGMRLVLPDRPVEQRPVVARRPGSLYQR
ncbi:MAG: LysM peptidoglycan-binding domain-containing protein [Planctomycetes bacterium]|nr:LysM peptidoglycan-binding domain-containing protein [Planctomycetota bacterium]